MKREDVYKLIDGERAYGDSMWPRYDGEAPNPLTIGEFILLIEEYASKARAGWAKEKKPEMETLKVIRKIAGIVVNCLEQHADNSTVRIFNPPKIEFISNTKVPTLS